VQGMGRQTAFGVDVWSDRPLEVLEGSRARATGRSLDLMVDGRAPIGPGWAPEPRLIGRQRRGDGSTVFAVAADEREGWLLSGAGYGEHLISADGLRLRCAPGGARPQDWQRFLVGQVLPFAAAVKGLELLHASAVVLDRRAVALLGPSGAGKTTLALALCELGAAFLADDVLALEAHHGLLLAHPGSPRAAVGSGDGERLRRVRGVEWPLLLTDLLLIERRAGGPRLPRFERCEQPAALLSGTFNLMLRDGERMSRLLEVAALAARGRVERVHADASLDAETLAEAVCERLLGAPPP
jgi:hypothetical protein